MMQTTQEDVETSIVRQRDALRQARERFARQAGRCFVKSRKNCADGDFDLADKYWHVGMDARDAMHDANRLAIKATCDIESLTAMKDSAHADRT